MASSVSLGKLESFVDELIKSGRYGSRGEVLREGVRLIYERETHLTALDGAIAHGVADADGGQLIDAEEAFDRLKARYRAEADQPFR